MPSGRVINEGEVYLNGRFYRIDGPVRRDLISQQPPKISIGAFTKDDNPVVSTVTWTKITGIGTATIEGPEDYTKAYYSNFPLLEGPIATNQADWQGGWFSAAAVALFYAPGTSSQLYVITSAAVEVSTGGGAASVSTRILAAQPTDSTWGYISTVSNSTVNKLHIVVAMGANGIDYAKGPPYNTWSSNSTAVQFVTFFQDWLWGINSSNEIMFTPSPGTTWTVEARVPVSTGAITGLLVAPSENEPEALYVVSDAGLHLYDRENTRFAHVPIAVKPSRFSGSGFLSWQGAIYYSAGMSVYRYTPSAGAVESIGLDRGTGLPENYRGTINSLTVLNRWLFAQVGNRGNDSIIEGIYRYNGQGWDQVVFASAESTLYSMASRPLGWHDPVSSQQVLVFDGPVGVSPANNIFRIYDSVDWDTHYASRGGLTTRAEMVLPWIKKDSDQTWLALGVDMDITVPATSQYVELAYGINHSTAFTTIGGSTATGLVSHILTTAASTNDQQGIAFDAIRFRIRGMSSKGSNSAGSPTIRRLTFSYKKSFKPIYAFSFIVDATEKYKGYEPAQIREGLEAVSTTPTLVEFTFKDELSATNVTEQHWVSLQQMQSAEETGKDSGKFIVRVAEAL